MSPVVEFNGKEPPSCILAGFSILNGENALTFGAGGGICGKGTRATIRYNIIAENNAFWGGGIAECGGLIEHNTIDKNNAEQLGGGLYLCNGTIKNNEITKNVVVMDKGCGGGLYGCGGNISYNIIENNRARGLLGQGGGLFNCNGVIEKNSIISNNATSQGGGIGTSFAQISGNRITNNQAADN